jgi:hypothetical protein
MTAERYWRERAGDRAVPLDDPGADHPPESSGRPQTERPGFPRLRLPRPPSARVIGGAALAATALATTVLVLSCGEERSWEPQPRHLQAQSQRQAIPRPTPPRRPADGHSAQRTATHSRSRKRPVGKANKPRHVDVATSPPAPPPPPSTASRTTMATAPAAPPATTTTATYVAPPPPSPATTATPATTTTSESHQGGGCPPPVGYEC